MDTAARKRADALYQADFQRDPDDYWLLFNYADFLEIYHDWKDAAIVWRKVGAMLPQYYLCPFQEGRMLERTGQLDEALAAFHRAVALYPRMASAWIEMGNIDLSQNNAEQARVECERAVALEPDQPAGLAASHRARRALASGWDSAAYSE